MIWLLLLIITITTRTIVVVAANAQRNDRLEIDQLRYEWLEKQLDLWMLVENLSRNKEIDINGQADVELIKKFEEFDIKLHEKFPQDVDYGLDSLKNLYTFSYAYNDLRAIHALYETFRRFTKMQTAAGRIPSPQLAWIDLTRAILDDKNNVNESLTRIEYLVDEKQLFFDVIQEVHGSVFCEAQQSPQQIILNLYNSIGVTELKGYTMVQFSYMLKKLYGHGNFSKEFELAQERFQNRSEMISKAVKKAMERSSKEMWRCDPKKHVLGETYEQITQLLQGYIQNEVDLNPEGTCRENCAEYQYTKSHGCYQNQWCSKQRKCNGKIVSCTYIDSDMWICPAETLQRRYEYVEYENGRVLGRKQSCRRGSTKVDSWWRWLFWHCSYCFCLCDEQGAQSDRYLNLRNVTADIANNKVVTGLRFIKRNRIIYLQIQEGKLLPRGRIDPNSVRWVPVEEYKITDKSIRNGIDYHTFTWEKRAFDLDDLYAKENHLVTGIKFKVLGSHVNFEIYTTPFDFQTGQLIEPHSRSVYKDNPNTDSSRDKPRRRLELKKPDIPTRTTVPSIPDSQHDQFVEFINSDMDRDAAQTTVPFLDAQPVASLEPVPLSGAGIFHKGQEYFGGFIAPKIMTLDFSNYVTYDAPNVEPPSN